MNTQPTRILQGSFLFIKVTAACTASIAVLLAATLAQGAINWDGEAGTPWWFNPVNWNVNSNANNLLPPNGGSAFDAQINIGSGAWDLFGEGVVYDPANDPHFADAQSLPYPPDRGPQIIDQLYISRNTTNHNLLTIKGDLTSMANVIVGRSGSTGTAPEQQNLGRINQLSGAFKVPLNVLDLGQREGSGWGNGIYDYRGGVLEVSLDGGNGLRLSPGGSAGPGGHGRFIMHNPATPGYVRAYDVNVAANAGQAGNFADGVTTGVGIVEFHFENGGTRPIQVGRNLIINNGTTEAGATRSSRLELVLNEAPCIGTGCIPVDVGLFDVAFIDPLGSSTTGAGDLGDFFSSADGSTLYNQDAIVSANFGGTQYNWTISYTGDITWADADAGTVASISGTGGVDVVLIGHSSVSGGLTGDYNNDGKVDAADYVLWRKNDINGAQGYTDWRNNFGAMAGSGAGSGLALAAGAVPEPGAIALALVAIVGGALMRRRAR
jgi:hypothetical protein